MVYGGTLTFNGAVAQSGPGPAGMAITVIGPGDGVTFDDAASFQGIVHCPQGNIDFNRSVDMTGSGIGNTIENLDGASTINYDPSLLAELPVPAQVQLVQLGLYAVPRSCANV